MNVEWIAVEGLTPHPKNSRLHSDEQVRAIAASIQRFGWTVPLLIDEGGGCWLGTADCVLHCCEETPAFHV